MSRSLVMTKCVERHVPSRHMPQTSATATNPNMNQVRPAFPKATANTIVTTKRARPVRTGSTKNNQCGWMSRITSSSTFRSCRGNDMTEAYGRGASGPAQLRKTGVADSEVMGHLMDDGDADLTDHVDLVSA